MNRSLTLFFISLFTVEGAGLISIDGACAVSVRVPAGAVTVGATFGMLPIIHQLVGSVLVVGGAILTPTPVPIGLVLLVIGLALLAPYIPAIQRLVRTIRRKWPNVDKSLLRHRDRFPPIIRNTIDKTHPQAPAE